MFEEGFFWDQKRQTLRCFAPGSRVISVTRATFGEAVEAALKVASSIKALQTK